MSCVVCELLVLLALLALLDRAMPMVYSVHYRNYYEYSIDTLWCFGITPSNIEISQMI